MRATARRALVPQPVDDERERAVAGGLGDADMEVAVGCVALLEIVAVRAHPRDARRATRQSAACESPARGERGDLAFDQLARGQELEGPRAVVVAFAAAPRVRDPRAPRLPATKMPVPTRTSTRPAISSEMMASRTDVRDTPSSTASSRSAGRREPGGEFAAVDQRGDLAGDLPVEPQRLDGLQRHDRDPPGKRRRSVCREACLLDGAVDGADRA